MRLFDIPFDRRLSPHIDAARRHHHQWIREVGLFRSEEAFAWHEEWDLARMVGGFLPDATGERLNICTDWNGVALAMDDQFDAGPLGRDAPASASVLQGITDSFFLSDVRTKKSELHPLAWAYADIMHRLRALMSPAWCARFALHNAKGLAGFLDEVVERTGGCKISGWEEFVELRRASGYMFIETDFIEVAQGYEVPEAIYFCKPMRTLLTCVQDLGAIHNDVYALSKERNRGETLKFTDMIQRHHACDETEAIRQSQLLNDQTIDRFLEAKEELTWTIGHLDLAQSDQTGISRFVDGMTHIISGVHDLHLESARYTDSSHFSPDTDGYVDDMRLGAAYRPGRYLGRNAQRGCATEIKD
jgi:hypothetical protein